MKGACMPKEAAMNTQHLHFPGCTYAPIKVKTVVVGKSNSIIIEITISRFKKAE